MRILGGLVAALLGLGILVLVVGFALSTRAQAYEAWWVSFPLGLPLVAIMASLAWAAWTGRRIRPAVGVAVTLAALVYTVLLAAESLREAWRVATSPHIVLPFFFIGWPVPVFCTLLGWLLLRKQRVAFAPLLFLGIALIWLAAWVGFWVILLPGAQPGAFWDLEALPVHGFFLLPMLMALAIALGRMRELRQR